MDKPIKDFVFMQHFNPLREPGLSPIKPCPFCQSKIYSTVDGKRTCFRCGKIYEDKNETE